jgi:hypothetical protein
MVIARNHNSQNRLLEFQCCAMRGANCVYSLRVSPLSLLFSMLIASLSQLSLLVGARSGLLKVARRHFDKPSFNQASHYWEFHPPIKVNVAIPIVTKAVLLGRGFYS